MIMMPRFATRSVAALAALACGLIALLAAQTSHATFRGENGRLLFQADVGPGGNTQLFTIEPDGTGLKQITHFKDSGGSNGNWSKDGSKIIFTRDWKQGGPAETRVIYTVNADGSGLRAIRRAGNQPVEPNWFPNGRRIVFLDVTGGGDHGGRLTVIGADGTGLRPAGVPGAGGDSACFLGNGHIALLRSKPTNGDLTAIFVAGLFGKGLKRVTPWGGHADKIDCSPDGTRIVYSAPAFGQDGKSSNVYTMKTDGTGVIQLTHETGGSVNAGADSWSPDGAKIAYVSNKNGTYQIWAMNADGSEPAQLTKGPESHLAAWGSHL
jgi:Tol biopolymer transport system component